jgi:hypothetical protein
MRESDSWLAASSTSLYFPDDWVCEMGSKSHSDSARPGARKRALADEGAYLASLCGALGYNRRHLLTALEVRTSSHKSRKRWVCTSNLTWRMIFASTPASGLRELKNLDSAMCFSTARGSYVRIGTRGLVVGALHQRGSEVAGFSNAPFCHLSKIHAH